MSGPSDDDILDMIFNPGIIIVIIHSTFLSSFPDLSCHNVNVIELQGAAMPTKLTDVQLGLKEANMPADVLDALQQLEAKGIKAAEEKDYKSAIKFFTEAITLRPSYLSAYNNRLV
jgi:hypothetical protein